MLRNYLKLAIRHLWKNRRFSVINIIGLVLGLASCVFILLYVHKEWHYDAFHENGNDIYRVTTFETDEGTERFTANTYHPLAPILESTFPEKTIVVRYFPVSISVKNLENNEQAQEKEFYFADSLFFQMFSFEFVKGDAKTTLTNPNSIVLTERTAKRYFGMENPMGKSCLLENKTEVVVTGVVKNPPKNSSLQFDFIAPMSGINAVFGSDYFHAHGAWFYPPVYTFVQIPETAFVSEWKDYQPIWKKANLPERLVDRYTFHLQPLKSMHFLALENDFAASTRRSFLWVLIAVSLLILGIACVNYVNMALTDLLGRIPEIGMRKVLGAANRNILHQILAEASVYIVLSFVIALGVAYMGLPLINRYIGLDITFHTPESYSIWMLLFGLMLGLILLIGVFPFFGLARYKVIGILKGKFALAYHRRTGFSLKKGLFVFQFAIAIGLVITTLVIQQQVRFLYQKDIGFRPEQVVVVPIRDEDVQKNYEAVKNELLSQPGVKSVSAISNFPWETGFYDFSTKIKSEGQERIINMPTLLVDFDFLKTMNIHLKEGRSFSKAFGEDKQSAFILNESAMEKYNLTSTEGAYVEMSHVAAGNPKEGHIVGVARNFHFKSLHNPIDPVILTVSPASYFLDNFVIRLETDHLAATIAGLSKNWAKIAPNRSFEYFFMDDSFNQLYEKESRMSKIFLAFTFLALVIALLGLYALSALEAHQRVKEIGIRKVLGASIVGIVGLLSKDFITLVLISVVIASPLAWYFMEEWLQNFAYRVEVNWWVFALSGGLAVLAAFITINFQGVRVALLNPVESLRSE